MGHLNRNWSMDSYVIENLNALIKFYIDADVQDNLEEMFKAVKNLEILISPKVKDTTEEYNNILWIRANMEHIFAYDPTTGKVRGINPANMNKVRGLLDSTYRSLLHKLEKAKIYTGEVIDPNKSMGYFGNS